MPDEPPIELVTQPVPRRPRLSGEVMIRKDADAAIDALLADLYIHATNCVRAFGDFHLAASPAPALEPVLMRLMYDPPYREFPWSRTRLWLTDEAAIAPGQSPGPAGPRWLALCDVMLEASGIPREQAHAIPFAPDAAAQYSATLRETLGWRPPGQDRLDFVLLSLEPDGSLGPVGAWADDEQLLSTQPGASVGMGRRLINSSRFVAIFATGPERLPGVLAQEQATLRPTHPGSGVFVPMPAAGEARWYLDHAACPAKK
ncbi:MAG: hypothetical protein GC200_06315 [Tepidisphaera sp.]|nr:hypothetical protein [Tepidisphaera sp.]